jgi:hypothetical protein
MARRSDRLWDKSDRHCLVCNELYTPVRYVQKFCPSPKKCRFTNKAKKLQSEVSRLRLPLVCKNCQEEFIPRASNQTTCGAECPGKPALVKTCKYAFCNKDFIVTRTYSPNRQVYCSDTCCNKEEVYRKYSISSHRYLELLEEQQGVCAGCLTPPRENERLHVDHDHSCCPDGKSCGKCIRGLLHRECNIVEGLFKDSPERLLTLAQILI